MKSSVNIDKSSTHLKPSCFGSSWQTSDEVFRIPKLLEDNLPSFGYFGKIALTA